MCRDEKGLSKRIEAAHIWPAIRNGSVIACIAEARRCVSGFLSCTCSMFEGAENILGDADSSGFSSRCVMSARQFGLKELILRPGEFSSVLSAEEFLPVGSGVFCVEKAEEEIEPNINVIITGDSF